MEVFVTYISYIKLQGDIVNLLDAWKGYGWSGKAGGDASLRLGKIPAMLMLMGKTTSKSPFCIFCVHIYIYIYMPRDLSVIYLKCYKDIHR